MKTDRSEWNAHEGLKEAAQRERARRATEKPDQTRPDAYRDLVRYGWQDWHGGNEL